MLGMQQNRCNTELPETRDVSGKEEDEYAEVYAQKETEGAKLTQERPNRSNGEPQATRGMLCEEEYE